MPHHSNGRTEAAVAEGAAENSAVRRGQLWANFKAWCWNCIFLSSELQECRVTSAATGTSSPLKIEARLAMFYEIFINLIFDF